MPSQYTKYTLLYSSDVNVARPVSTTHHKSLKQVSFK